jgi:serine/threonine protein kinase
MPFYYRTPDLVAYAKNEADITVKSDVFQLGLVLAQLFSGWNPCKKAENRLAPVELERIENIPGKLGGSIWTILSRMLIIDPVERPNAADVLNLWQLNFFSAVQHNHALEGQAF